MKVLEVRDLHVNVEGKEILKGINLDLFEGKVHVVMGPNGAGKSTLTNTIMGHPKYEISKGTISFKGEVINDLKADERARRGIFMSFQNPKEVAGVTVSNFIRASRMSITGQKESLMDFQEELHEKMEDLSMDKVYADRYLNVGFSGGEKKKTEILQMAMLNPSFVMLDETDSGLDIDAVRIVSKNIEKFRNQNKTILIITHHKAILSRIKPDYVHVLIDGNIVKTSDASLVTKIQQEGYSWIKQEV